MNGVPSEFDLHEIQIKISKFYDFESRELHNLEMNRSYRTKAAAVIHDLFVRRCHPCQCGDISIDPLEYLVKKTNDTSWEFRCESRCWPIVFLWEIADTGKVEVSGLLDFYSRNYKASCYLPNPWICESFDTSFGTYCGGCYIKAIISSTWASEFIVFR